MLLFAAGLLVALPGLANDKVISAAAAEQGKSAAHPDRDPEGDHSPGRWLNEYREEAEESLHNYALSKCGFDDKF